MTSAPSGHRDPAPPPPPDLGELPSADPGALERTVADSEATGARYGVWTLRAASVRGAGARLRGEPRRDGLLVARFGTGESALVLVALASGTPLAADATRWLGGAVGRSHARLVQDIRAGRRGDLTSGLHRITDRVFGRLRSIPSVPPSPSHSSVSSVSPVSFDSPVPSVPSGARVPALSLRCLLLPADPGCRDRVFFGVGPGGFFRLRDGRWQDIGPALPAPAPPVPESRREPTPLRPARPVTIDGDRVTMDLRIAAAPPPPPAEPFRFRAAVARPGDLVLLCGPGLAAPMRADPALAAALAGRWAASGPPALPAFLTDLQLGADHHGEGADQHGEGADRTAAAVWDD
ncbi:protein phosphatase 2C domain-containing protein [Streptomyces sp. NPDC057638]|uniref:protein phosphatase 2C domain-containing protein n=1 Tax=Streptomyces sp. NPDC057638 TaxID=3346190 RepID=UPI003695E4B0